jgi:hypothetical protein
MCSLSCTGGGSLDIPHFFADMLREDCNVDIPRVDGLPVYSVADVEVKDFIILLTALDDSV